MFDYNSSETIINGLYMADGTTPLWKVLNAVVDTSLPPVLDEDPLINYFGGAKAFWVTRIAKFIDTLITQVWRNPFVAPVKEVATATVPLAGIVAGKVYRLVIDMILTQGSQSAEYARWAIHKGKPVYVEVMPTATIAVPATAAAWLATNFTKGLKKMNIDETDIVIADGAGDTFTVTAKSEFIRFKYIAVEELSPIGDGTGEDPEGDPASLFIAFDASTAVPAVGKFVISTAGVEGFGTYNYMISNLRIPTAEQTRFAGIGQDALPIPGANYTQFVVEYKMKRGITGNNVVAAPAESLTRHTFYVIDDAGRAPNPAAQFWTDLTTVTNDPLKESDVVLSLAKSATSDGILESTVDNIPII